MTLQPLSKIGALAGTLTGTRIATQSPKPIILFLNAKPFTP